MKIITMPGLNDSQIKKNTPFPIWLPIGLVVLTYCLLHSNYNIFFVDDSWTISNTWNFINKGVANDLVFIDSDKLGYHQLFGFSYHYVMGTLLNLIGWTKSNVFLINTAIIGLAIWTWWFILKALPFSKMVAQLTISFMPIFPPFFFAAHSGRSDAMIICLISLQFLLFIKRRYLPAAFLLGLSMEIHPMGIIGFFFILAYAIYKRKQLLFNSDHLFKIVSYSLIGGLLSVGYYFALHWDIFYGPELVELISKKSDMSSPVNNYILNYFARYDWKMHLWELALLIGALTLYFKKGVYKKNSFLTTLLIVLVLSTFITRRENSTYLVFIYPVFILIFFYTFEQLFKLREFAFALLFALSGYYGFIFVQNHEFKFGQITEEIHSELVDSSKLVVGMPDVWFAAMDRDFLPIYYFRDLNKIAFEDFYLVETEYLKYSNRVYTPLVSYFKENFDCKELKTIKAYRGEVARVCACSSLLNVPVPEIAKRESPGWRTRVNAFLEYTLFSENRTKSSN